MLPPRQHGQLILSRTRPERVRASVLEGRQGRTVLIAEIRVRGRLLAVATTHMESYLDDGPVRARQLTAIFGMLEHAEDAVLMGDLNFGDGAELEIAQIPATYRDVWQVLKPDKAGFTWNNEENPIAGIGAFVGEPNRRLDRILLRAMLAGGGASVCPDGSCPTRLAGVVPAGWLGSGGMRSPARTLTMIARDASVRVDGKILWRRALRAGGRRARHSDGTPEQGTALGPSSEKWTPPRPNPRLLS